MAPRSPGSAVRTITAAASHGAGWPAIEFPAGIDYAIGRSDLIGQGIGSATVAAFSEALFEAHPDVTDIVVTPQAANGASCRILEQAGYQRRWTGLLDSEDPGDAGPAAMYVLPRQRLIVAPERP